MTLNRRQALVASLLPLIALSGHAQNYPQKQITLVVSYSAGGNADLRARMLGTAVAKTWGVPLVVENKPGANGNIGHEYVAKAPPDGHTLVIATMGPMAVSSYVYPKLGFDPEASFTPIVLIEKAPMVLVTRTDKPFQSLKELVSFGLKNPDQLSFGNAGPGSAHHLSAELFLQNTGIKGLSVPYKGGSQAATALLAGDIESAQEAQLLDRGIAPLDLLLVPHHGSKTSSSGPFLDALQPRLALVQAGYRNRFSENLTVIGNGMWRSQEDLPANVEFNLKFLFKDKFWVGGGHRVDYANNAQLGVLMGKLRIGYVYEWPMLQSYLLPNPTHEFMVSMRLFGGDAAIW